MQLDRDGAIGGRIKGPIREGIMLATGSQLARRSLGILRQQLEHHVQLIEHARIRHHWVLGFLKTRNSKLETRNSEVAAGQIPATSLCAIPGWNTMVKSSYCCTDVIRFPPRL